MSEQNLDLSQEFERRLASLRQKICWSALGGVGSMFYLDIGGKVPLFKPLRNPNLRPDQANFDGEYILGVHFAAWKLMKNNRLWCDSETSEDKITRLLRILEQREILSTSIALDWSLVRIDFSGGYSVTATLSLGSDKSRELVSVKTPSGWISLEWEKNRLEILKQ